MRVCLYVDQGRTLRWHRWLAQALNTAGNQVHLRFSPQQAVLPAAYQTLFALEKVIPSSGSERVRDGNAADPISASDVPVISYFPLPGQQEIFDVVINLAADLARIPHTRRVLTPCFNSAPTVFGAIAALLANEPLHIELHDSNLPEPISAYPAIADHEVISRGLDNVLSCTTSLIVKTIATTHTVRWNPSRGLARNRVPPAMRTRAYAHMVKMVISKAHRYLQIKSRGPCDWSMAWRYDSMPLMDRGSAKFRVVRNPKDHYYGDPFPFRHNGADFIFFEDWDYTSGRAHIAVVEVSKQAISTARPVLDTGYHMSYPFVFSYDNQIWMIPETGVVRDIKLYRAVKFPYEWECQGPLLSLEGYDATLLLPQGEEQRFWLFTTECMWNSTGWDTVSVFHSDKLLGGDWIPHTGGNPLLIDARKSRPAGRFFRYQGRLIRPVQDCSRVYGGSVHLCSIDKLSTDAFEQHEIGTIHCAAGHRAYRGCHTYNYSDGLEVIDIFDRGVANEVTAFYRPVEQQQIEPKQAISERTRGFPEEGAPA